MTKTLTFYTRNSEMTLTNYAVKGQIYIFLRIFLRIKISISMTKHMSIIKPKNSYCENDIPFCIKPNIFLEIEKLPIDC